MKKSVMLAVILLMIISLTISVSAQYYDSKGYYHDEYGKVYAPGTPGTVGQGILGSSKNILSAGATTKKKSSFQTITSFILDVFSLKWLKVNPNAELDRAAKFAAVARFMIWLTVLILVHEGLRHGIKQFSARSRKTLAVVIATMAAIFIHPNLLIGIGGLYGAIIAMLFIGVPLILAAIIVFAWPDTSRAVVVIKILILTAIVWLFNLMSAYLPSMASGTW